jgi:hypothetical protein
MHAMRAFSASARKLDLLLWLGFPHFGQAFRADERHRFVHHVRDGVWIRFRVLPPYKSPKFAKPLPDAAHAQSRVGNRPHARKFIGRVCFRACQSLRGYRIGRTRGNESLFQRA